MKNDIHPEYHKDAKVICACGNTFTIGSTSPELHIELCSACHPFYTGKQKVMDAAGRVDRFKKRVELQTTTAVARVGKRVKKARDVEHRKAKAMKLDEGE